MNNILKESFELALTEHRSGNYLKAIDFYLKAVVVEPNHELSQHHLSVIYYELGRFSDAIKLNRNLVKLNPDNTGYWNNKGNTLLKLNLPEDAYKSFSNAIEINSPEPRFLVNRSNSLIALNKFDIAMDDLNKSIELDSSLVIGYANRANLHMLLGDHNEALKDINIAISLENSNTDLYFNLGNILEKAGDIDKSIDIFHQVCLINKKFVMAFINLAELLNKYDRNLEAINVLEEGYINNPDSTLICLSLSDSLVKIGQTSEAYKILKMALLHDPKNEDLRYSIASINGRSQPLKSPENYVKRLFNVYAPTFDNHLQNILQYRTPYTIRDQLIKFNTKIFNCALDLGCGTGLVGVALDGMYKEIDGVDLSNLMLEECKSKEIYNELFLDDIENFLNNTSTTYDLIVAADVFVYIGSLDLIFHNISNVLNQNGLFIFSIEYVKGYDFELQPTKRYGHTLTYIEKLSLKMGLNIVEIKSELIRKENLKDINGFTVLLQKI
jgi:predicted TPR repeat methyltransferase